MKKTKKERKNANDIVRPRGIDEAKIVITSLLHDETCALACKLDDEGTPPPRKLLRDEAPHPPMISSGEEVLH